MKKETVATKRAAAWKRIFLAALADKANVASAAGIAGITKANVYQARNADEQFSLDWDEALEKGIAALEDAARGRALEGLLEPVYHQGEVVGHVRKFDTTLTIFLLKAHRPEIYRDRVDMHHSGEVKANVQIYLPDNKRNDA